MIFICMVLVVTASTCKTFSLKDKSRELEITQTQLEQQLADAKVKKEELEKQGKYMKTTKYIEDEAKDKLGLVYPDEIVIKPNDN